MDQIIINPLSIRISNALTQTNNIYLPFVLALAYTLLSKLSLDQLRKRNIPYAIGFFIMACIIDQTVGHFDKDDDENKTDIILTAERIIKIVRGMFIIGISAIIMSQYRDSSILSRLTVVGSLIMITILSCLGFSVIKKMDGTLMSLTLYSVSYLAYWQQFDNPFT